VIGAEQDLLATMAAHIVDELAWIAADPVRRGVDVDVWILGRERDHLRGPRPADVSAENGELGKLERDAVEIGDRAARLPRAQRAGVVNLRAERDTELDAFGIERIVAPAVRRQVPQPRPAPQ